jgi:hypothetical protein
MSLGLYQAERWRPLAENLTLLMGLKPGASSPGVAGLTAEEVDALLLDSWHAVWTWFKCKAGHA